jgi:plasmid stabilization system protein ParE
MKVPSRYPVVFTPEALQQLEGLYTYIARDASPLVALRYTDAIVTYCETLQTFPLRGARRDDIRPGLRVTNYKGRAVIAFDVSSERVNVIGIFYGGQDYQTTLNPSESDIGQ